MRPIILCMALALGGCQTFLSPNPKLPPDIQAKQAETAQGFYKALGERLMYCTITGTIDIAVKASPDAGLANTAGLNCPAKPWEQASPVVTLDQIGKLIDDRVVQKLDEFTAPK